MATTESELASLQRVQDRVQSAKSEDLPSILAALLPKLVALSNQDPLRTKTIAVLSECMKRLKLAKIPMDLSGILGSIHPRMLPFAANLAISFVDVAIEYGVSKTDQKAAVSAVLSGLSEFAPFSPQSNALCYYAIQHLSSGLSAHATSGPLDSSLRQAQSVLGDFAIDIAMLQRPLVVSAESSAVGSVQPGLSASRVDRLTYKKKSWSAADLKLTKLQLINLIPSGIFLPQHAVFLSIILSNDADADVSTQATFKMNGCVNMLHIDKNTTTATEVCDTLVNYCCSEKDAQKNKVPIVNIHKRSQVRADVRLATVRWLVRHLSAHLVGSAKATVTLVFQGVFSPGGGAPEAASIASALTEEVAVVGASLQLLQALLERAEATVVTDKVLLIMLCVKRVLQAFAYSTTSFAAGEHHMAVRSACYHIVEAVAGKFRALRKAATELQVNAIAQQAEVTADEDATSSIEDSSAVESKMDVSILPTPVPAPAPPAVPSAEEASLAMYRKVTIEDAALLMLLFQLLDREHAQRNEASILALYRAMNSLREAYILVQNTPEWVSSDPVVSSAGAVSAVSAVSGAVSGGGLSADQLSKLQDLLRSARRSDKDLKMRLAALQWGSALFHQDAFVIETAYLLADDPSEAVVTSAVAEFSRLRAHLQSSISSTGHNSPQVLSAFLPVLTAVLTLIVDTPEVVQNTPESLGKLTGLHYLLDAAALGLRLLQASPHHSAAVSHLAPLLDRVLRVVAAIALVRPVVSIPGVPPERRQEALFSSQRADLEALKGHTEPVVENTHPSGGNITSTVGTASTAGKAAAGRVVETINPHLLRSVSSITSAVIKLTSSSTDAGAVKLTARELIPQYMSWLALPEYDVRAAVASVLTAVCVDGADGATVNVDVTFGLVRQLSHKLSHIVKTPEAQPDSTAKSTTAAGALRCMGGIVALLAQASVMQTSVSHSETQHLADQLLSQLIACLELDSTSSVEHCLLQVVALEVLEELSVKNVITSAPSAGRVTLCVADDSAVYAQIVKLVHHKDHRVSVPAMHVYTNLCTAGVDVSQVAAFWGEMMKATLRGTENQCVKFAWAEALVSVCSLPLSRAELCASSHIGLSEASAYLTAQAESIDATASQVPVLMHYLLHLIDTSSKSTEVSAPERSTYCVALLVLVKACAPGRNYPASLVRKIVEIFLRFMRDKDLFIQDMCCMALCHLYNNDAATSEVPQVVGLTGPAGQPVSVSEYVSYEVMVTLMRERRAAQPAGYNVGSTATSASTTQAQQRERAANQPPAPPAETGAVAGGGGTGPPREDNHLMQAAVAAAAELGVGLTFGGGGEELGSQQTDQLPQDYVVYTTICKMAKQAKDSSILFAVLSLIKRDPIFGTGPSRSLHSKYAAPAVHMSSKKLVEMLPMLYHARFDPNTTVRPVMRALWDTLLEAHFPQAQHLQLDLVQRRVVAFLVQRLSSPNWRDREASCLALEAFLPRRAWMVSMFPLLEELFHSALKVLDDMRDSTRGAALAYTKALSSHIVRACNSEESPEGVVTAAVDRIVPLLLEKGLVAPSAEARGVSLGLLGKVVEAAKSAPALRKWLARVISVLVEGMSALEPQTLQYMQFHTARLRISEEELEGMRIKMAQSSPLQEALEICLSSLHQATSYDTNAATIPEVVQGLSLQLQRGVGLATRVAAAQSLSQLAKRYPVFLGKGSSGAKPASEAFRCIIWSLTQAPHMAVTLKKAMTSAFGALCKVVDEEVLATECEMLVSKYSALQRDQLDQSVVLAQCIQQIVQRGGSRLEEGVDNRLQMWQRNLACAYLGSHDSDAESKAVWTATWQEALSASGVGTKLSAVLQILPQLLGMVHAVYRELSWHRRLQAVQVLREVVEILPAESLAAQLEAVNGPFTELLTTLMHSIPGQVWGGQAAVLELVSELMSRCKAHVSLTPLSASDESIPVLVVGDKTTTFADLTGGPLGKSIADSGTSHLIATDTKTAQASPPRWHLSFLGWALLLVHESRRGARNNTSTAEAEYRQAAARALSLLPWPLLATTPEGVSTFVQLLPLLCRQGGVPPYAPAVLVAAEAGAASGAESGVKADSRPNKRLLGNAALFGVRYKTFNEPARAKVPSTVAGAMVVDELLPVAAELDAGEVLVEKEVEMEVDVESETPEELTAMETLSTTDEPDTTAAVTPPSMKTVLPSADSPAPDAETQDTDVAVLESTAGAVYVEYEHKHPPVYHIYYLECLLRGWPRALSTSTAEEALLSEGLQHVLSWAELCMHTAVWSVRKTAVQLVGVLCSARTVTPVQCESALLVIELAIAEQKFVKVRVEALKSLASLLQSANRTTIDASEGLKGRIRELIRTASTDSQPTILEAVSKVQNLWLK